MVLSNDLLELWIPLVRALDRAHSNFAKELLDAIVKRLDVKEGKQAHFIVNNQQ